VGIAIQLIHPTWIAAILNMATTQRTPAIWLRASKVQKMIIPHVSKAAQNQINWRSACLGANVQRLVSPCEIPIASDSVVGFIRAPYPRL
jgi:hypothetical protein